jgi:hypothetical protein
VSEPSDQPTRYRLSYSGRVQDALRALLKRALARGFGRQVVDAVRVIHERLQVYPQYGEERRDLRTKGQKQWTMTIPPLVVDYVIDEEHRIVFVATPFRVLPRSGL